MRTAINILVVVVVKKIKSTTLTLQLGKSSNSNFYVFQIPSITREHMHVCSQYKRCQFIRCHEKPVVAASLCNEIFYGFLILVLCFQIETSAVLVLEEQHKVTTNLSLIKLGLARVQRRSSHQINKTRQPFRECFISRRHEHFPGVSSSLLEILKPFLVSLFFPKRPRSLNAITSTVLLQNF